MVNLLSELNVQRGHAPTVLPGIAALFPRLALCYTQTHPSVPIFVKQLHVEGFADATSR
jgi:hypothetical protein